MLVVFHGIDRPGGAELRAQTRAAHLEFQSQRTNLVGGPLFDSNGDVCGSLIIFEATDVATASAQMADDPYVQAELFSQVSVTELHAAVWPTTAAG